MFLVISIEVQGEKAKGRDIWNCDYVFFMSGSDPKILGQDVKNWYGIVRHETCFSLG